MNKGFTVEVSIKVARRLDQYSTEQLSEQSSKTTSHDEPLFQVDREIDRLRKLTRDEVQRVLVIESMDRDSEAQHA